MTPPRRMDTINDLAGLLESEGSLTGHKVANFPQPKAAITGDWLLSTIGTARRHIEPGAPMYLTADALSVAACPTQKSS